MRERVETTRERPKFVNSPRMCVCMRVHVGCIVDVLSLHTPTQPAHYVHRFSLPRRAAPHRVLLSPVPYAAPRAFPHPSLSTTLEIHLVVCLSPRLASPRLASPRLASSSFSLSAAISLPRGVLARGATSDALCCRRVVAAAASIPRLSRFRLGCRRGSCGDSRPPNTHLSLRDPREELKNVICYD